MFMLNFEFKKHVLEQFLLKVAQTQEFGHTCMQVLVQVYECAIAVGFFREIIADSVK